MQSAKFSALVCYEGSKRGIGASLRITVPADQRDLKSAFAAPGWVRITVDGCAPFFAYARRPKSRSSIEITLPRWRLPDLRKGDIVAITAENAAKFIANNTHPLNDWLPFVLREHYFPEDTTGNGIALWNQHSEPFLLHRSPTDSTQHWWLLGFYQAEGSKSATGADFSAANTLPALLRSAIAALAAWGISRDRLYMGVLHRLGTPAEPAIAQFEPLGVTITYVRATAKNDATGILHVYQSLPLMRMVRERLRVLFDCGFVARQDALAYALGWLDGDGNVTRRNTSYELVLAGGEAEHEVVKAALIRAFSWSFGPACRYINTNDGTRITMQAHMMLDLLDARAFIHSMNRVRLLLAFGDRTERQQLTKASARVVAGRVRYERAIELARTIQRTRRDLFGKKCVPYPPEMEEL